MFPNALLQQSIFKSHNNIADVNINILVIV